MSRIEIRAHHGLCTYFFEGKGYSDDFNHHMAAVIKTLEKNPVVRIVNHDDEICNCCPNLRSGICKEQAKVLAYDGKVLELCRLQPNTEIPWQEFVRLVRENIIDKKRLAAVCSNCQWWEVCHKKSLKNDR